VHSGNPPGDAPEDHDEKWHHGNLAGTVEGSGPHRLDRLCPAGWAEVHSETDPIQTVLHVLTWTMYAPQTVQVVCVAPDGGKPPPTPTLRSPGSYQLRTHPAALLGTGLRRRSGG
jgi:hypothetical protein